MNAERLAELDAEVRRLKEQNVHMTLQYRTLRRRASHVWNMISDNSDRIGQLQLERGKP